MYVTLASGEKYHDAIVGLRKEICRTIGLDPEGPSVEPLPVAYYLFALTADDAPPVGMIEFFFYDQMFERYSDAVYAQAYDLASIAPMSEMAHIRSAIIAPGRRLSSVFRYLSAAMVAVAYGAGARYMTAATGAGNDAILGLHNSARMRPLGSFRVDGSDQKLSLLDLEPYAQRALDMSDKQRFLRVDPELVRELRGRRRQAP